jgi:hypothetical protein
MRWLVLAEAAVIVYVLTMVDHLAAVQAPPSI